MSARVFRQFGGVLGRAQPARLQADGVLVSETTELEFSANGEFLAIYSPGRQVWARRPEEILAHDLEREHEIVRLRAELDRLRSERAP